VEVTASGVFMRAIAVKKGSYPYGVAHCCSGDVIAVSLNDAHAVVLLEYESGVVEREVTIGLGKGCGDGQLQSPYGATFTTDGRYFLVADCGNNRVSKFSAASGEFVAHVATKATHGISDPRDVIQCEDGSVVVAQGRYADGRDARVVCVGEDGGLVQNIIIPIIPSASEGVFIPTALTYFPSLKGVVVKIFSGKAFLLRDAWMSSNRCAWLSALSCC
jgi:hypothetical protein